MSHPERPGRRGPVRVTGLLFIALSIAVGVGLIAAGPGTAVAQENGPPEAPTETSAPAEPAPPEVIPLPEVAARADETTRRLRESRAAARPSSQVEAIESGLGERRARITERRERRRIWWRGSRGCSRSSTPPRRR